jgi:hypothetical protein
VFIMLVRLSISEMPYTLVLLRHGESQWNAEVLVLPVLLLFLSANNPPQNRFTGWVDSDLADKGVAEAHHAAKLLRDGGFAFDCVYSSVLTRAIRTANIVLEDMRLLWVPFHKTWRLNERMCGVTLTLLWSALPFADDFLLLQVRCTAGAGQEAGAFLPRFSFVRFPFATLTLVVLADCREARRRNGANLASELRHTATCAGPEQRVLARPRQEVVGAPRAAVLYGENTSTASYCFAAGTRTSLWSPCLCRSA